MTETNMLVVPNDPLSNYVKQGNFTQFIDRFKYYARHFDRIYIYNCDSEKIRYSHPNITIINRAKKWYIPAILQKLYDLNNICKSHDIDIIRVLEGATFTKAFVGGLIGKIHNKRVVVSVHGVWDEWLSVENKGMFTRIMVALLGKLSGNMADMTFCVSEKVSRSLELWKNKKIIPNYVDTGKFKPIRCRKRYDIIYVGSIMPLKGISILIEAFKIVKKKHKDAKMLMVGKQYMKVPDVKNIYYMGPENHEKLSKLYNESKIFVSASLTEGFGIPLIEAQACGIPVVCSDIDAFRENTILGKTSILVTPKDSAKLAEKITELLDDKDRRERMGLAGLKFVRRRFSREIILKREVEEIWEMNQQL